MRRFDKGDVVKVVGPLSEHYGDTAATILEVYLHPDFPHLNRYRIDIPGAGIEVFYEFQLTRSADCATRAAHG